MATSKTSGSRGAALVLVIAGLLVLLLSFQRWTSCPTTPCGGILMAISDYSGTDLGFGVITALAGLLVAAIGVDALRHHGVSRFASAAAPLALVIVVTIGASVVWMYVIPGEDKEYYWPPFTALLVGIVGLIAVAASVRLGHATLARS